jgi:TRAP-type C4-dicarboxylate transport system permease large subunit
MLPVPNFLWSLAAAMSVMTLIAIIVLVVALVNGYRGLAESAVVAAFSCGFVAFIAGEVAEGSRSFRG